MGQPNRADRRCLLFLCQNGLCSLSHSLSTTETGMPHHQAGMLCRPAEMHVSRHGHMLDEGLRLAAAEPAVMQTMWLPQ